jgi:hypothetical protein
MKNGERKKTIDAVNKGIPNTGVREDSFAGGVIAATLARRSARCGLEIICGR